MRGLLAPVAVLAGWLCLACGAPAPPRATPFQATVHHAHLLSELANDWEPALAAGPDQTVFVTAGRRFPRPDGASGGPPFEQRIVIWRSSDSGVTWEGPWPVSDGGSFQGDQRVAVDDHGVVHVSYMDLTTTPEGQMSALLQLATSRDGGRSFTVQTVLDHGVSDKPELAVSRDGRDIYLVLESRPGPSLIGSHDGGETWGGPRVVVPVEDRETHFWPTGLALAPDGRLWFSVPSIPNDELQKGGPSTTTLHVYSSDDGGESWHETDLGSSPWTRGGCVHDSECRVKTAYPGIAVDAVGRAYAVYTEGSAGQPYWLLLRISADGGETWTAPQPVSEAPRPATGDLADHNFPMIAAARDGRACVAWVDDRTGPRSVWARCTDDAGVTWGDELLLSNVASDQGHTADDGFAVFYGDYGGVAPTDSGRLYVTWSAAASMEGPGAVWVGSADVFPPSLPERG
jgi:hypothetical protein